ncbi:hypothetical protein, no similarity [Maudiozyma saulgeensis]|uniref:PA14 domain-containing protein n=1 Tax=Maudiozyma saulgeensis TaxID=1789683 RepID=A0A1X7R918_9SACH|nr:hypothetical protein, no similarity [Kazachstania saulgeensis]
MLNINLLSIVFFWAYSFLSICLAEENPHGFDLRSLQQIDPSETNGLSLCSAQLEEPRDGLKARFYRYVYAEDTPNILDENFLDHEYYMGNRYLGEVGGVYDTNFFYFYGTISGAITEGEINGFSLTISNFSVEYSGWFVPKTSGIYTFQIGQTDDGSLFQMFGSTDYFCCSDTETQNFTLYSIQYYDNTDVQTATMDMIAGESYPFRIVFFNRDAVAIQTISFIDPEGVVHKDFTGYAKYYNNVICPVFDDDTYIPPQPIEPSESTAVTQVETVTATFTVSQDASTVTTTEVVTSLNQTQGVTITETITFSAEASTIQITETIQVPTVTSLLTVTDIVTLDGQSTTLADVITLEPESSVTAATSEPVNYTSQDVATTFTSFLTETIVGTENIQYMNSSSINTQYSTVIKTIYSKTTLFPITESDEKSIINYPIVTSEGHSNVPSSTGASEEHVFVASSTRVAEETNFIESTTTTVVSNRGEGGSRTSFLPGNEATKGIENNNGDKSNSKITVFGKITTANEGIRSIDSGVSKSGIAVLSSRAPLTAVTHGGAPTANLVINSNDAISGMSVNIFFTFVIIFLL